MSLHRDKLIPPLGRRSPGRKALFSSVHPAPASWTAPVKCRPFQPWIESPANRGKDAQPGAFTLIEVMLALAISAIVLVAISMAFTGALQLRDHSDSKIQQSLPVERAMDLIGRDLKNAVAPGLMLAGPLQSGAYEAGMDANTGIQIYTTTGLLTPNQPWGEIQKITYGLQTSSASTNNGKDLIRAVTRNLLATGPEDEDDQFVMSGVQSLSFSYYDGANWMDTWDSSTESNLPLAVKVSLQLAQADSDSPAPQPYQLLVPLESQVDTNLLDQWEAWTNSGDTAAGGGTSAN